MSVNERIELVLAQIVKNIWPFADDTDQEWLQHMQVHLYTKSNYTERRREIRKALREAGAVVTDIITLHEKDSGYHHLCFSCIFEEDMEE